MSEDRPSALLQGIKARAAEFAVGIVAHYCRLLALAPVLGASFIALMMAGALTQTSVALASVLERILPEEIHTFQGGVTEFGLPIALEYASWVFWIPFAIGIVEQLSGRRLRRGALHAKLWLGILAVVFGTITLVTILFMDVEDDRIAMSFMALFLNGVLFFFALGGVAAFLFISFVEEQLAKKMSQAGLSIDESFG